MAPGIFVTVFGFALVADRASHALPHLDTFKNLRGSELQGSNSLATRACSSNSKMVYCKGKPMLNFAVLRPIRGGSDHAHGENFTSEEHSVADQVEDLLSTSRSEIIAAFHTLDCDHSGIITKAELGPALHILGIKTTPPELDVIFDVLDENKDNAINLEVLPSASIPFHLDIVYCIFSLVSMGADLIVRRSDRGSSGIRTRRVPRHRPPQRVARRRDDQLRSSSSSSSPIPAAAPHISCRFNRPHRLGYRI